MKISKMMAATLMTMACLQVGIAQAQDLPSKVQHKPCSMTSEDTSAGHECSDTKKMRHQRHQKDFEQNRHENHENGYHHGQHGDRDARAHLKHLAIQACASKSAGDTCQVQAPRGNVKGSCHAKESFSAEKALLACRPAHKEHHAETAEAGDK